MADEIGALREVDLQWSRAWEAKDLERVLSTFTGDAVMLAATRAGIRGKKAIRELLAQAFALPGLTSTIEVIQAEVAVGGDLGYTLGTYETAVSDPEGQPRSHRGKYVAIWKKQADGAWRVAVHSSSPD